MGYGPGVMLLFIPLFVVGIFVLPFAMARLEPKKAPTHRGPSRRVTSR